VDEPEEARCVLSISAPSAPWTSPNQGTSP
jgi:hypothetical protein